MEITKFLASVLFGTIALFLIMPWIVEFLLIYFDFVYRVFN